MKPFASRMCQSSACTNRLCSCHSPSQGFACPYSEKVNVSKTVHLTSLVEKKQPKPPKQTTKIKPQKPERRNSCSAFSKEGAVAGLVSCDGQDAHLWSRGSALCLQLGGYEYMGERQLRWVWGEREINWKAGQNSWQTGLHAENIWNLHLCCYCPVKHDIGWSFNLCVWPSLDTGVGVAVSFRFLLLSVLVILLCFYFSRCTREWVIHRLQDVIQPCR